MSDLYILAWVVLGWLYGFLTAAIIIATVYERRR